MGKSRVTVRITAISRLSVRRYRFKGRKTSREIVYFQARLVPFALNLRALVPLMAEVGGKFTVLAR